MSDVGRDFGPPRTFEVSVRGYPPVTYTARSAAKARMEAFRSYSDVNDITFRDFLGISSVRSCGVPADDGYSYIRRAYGFSLHIGDKVSFRGEPGLEDQTGVIGYPGRPTTCYVHVWIGDRQHEALVHPLNVIAALDPAATQANEQGG